MKAILMPKLVKIQAQGSIKLCYLKFCYKNQEKVLTIKVLDHQIGFKCKKFCQDLEAMMYLLKTTHR